MSENRRVVITGLGVVSPIGNDADSLWNALSSGKSGVDFLERINSDGLSTNIGGEVKDFTGDIADFGDLSKDQKRSIRKGIRLMCREIEMGVAVAQKSLQNAKLELETQDLDRTGVIYGCDYILTEPFEFIEGVAKCLEGRDEFDFTTWGKLGLPKVSPLWLLKYLPNMPASHIAIYNDFRGPNNSITLREASANLAFGEAYCTIIRNNADTIVSGATGTRIHPIRSIHACIQEQTAPRTDTPATASRPFDKNRAGLVLGEGAGAIVLEELETARKRGASIVGEIVGYGSSTVMSKSGVADFETAISNSVRGALRSAEMNPEDIGHVNAHGLSGVKCDACEATAIAKLFANNPSPIPVVAPKSNFGNLGAGSGAVELIASLKSLEHGVLFPSLNYDTPDDDCPINLVTSNDVPAGDSFINLNVSPFGQASATIVKKFD